MEESSPKLVQTEAHCMIKTHEKKLQAQGQQQELFSSQE